ncbi:Tbingi protein [Trypanosoma theileri]|uniref:Tbingi protein n=1 Tax=Trypanosoma theileri TaxID=67003 RepID=A0A1X0NSM2_9TRYP|nr:Tbingi protein [Trypanosoma theileri]ORC87694.1 Tbingi protein [Trypanosoma theileri]
MWVAILMQERRSTTYGQQTHGLKRADALWKIKFPHEPPPPDIPPEPPPPSQPPPPATTLPRPNSPKAKLHPFACSICKRTFPLQNGLTRHLRYMHNVTCHVPERKRPRIDDLTPEGQTFPCDKCDMITRSKTGLKSHIRARHPENPPPPKKTHLALSSSHSLLHYDAHSASATLATLELLHTTQSLNTHLELQFCQQQYK